MNSNQKINDSVSDNRLAFILPFRFFDEQSEQPSFTPEAIELLKAYKGERLQCLLGDVCDIGDLTQINSNSSFWTQGSSQISTDFYPIAKNILFGDENETELFNGSLPFELNKEVINKALNNNGNNLWVEGLKLANRNNQALVQLTILDADVYFIGSGFGFLVLQLKASLISGDDIDSSDLLKITHYLTQPPRNHEGHIRHVRTKNISISYKDLSFDPKLDKKGKPVLDKEGKPLKGKLSDQQIFFKSKSSGSTDLPISAYAQTESEGHEFYRVITGLERYIEFNNIDKEEKINVCVEILPIYKSDKPFTKGKVVTHLKKVTKCGEVVAYGNFKAIYCLNERELLALPSIDNNDLIQWMLALLPFEDNPNIFKSAFDENKLRLKLPKHQKTEVADVRDMFVNWRLFSFAGLVLTKNTDAKNVTSFDRYIMLAHKLSHHFDDKYSPTLAEAKQSTFQPFDTIYQSVAVQGASVVIADDGKSEHVKNFLGNSFLRVYLPVALINYHEYIYLLHLVQGAAIFTRDVPTAIEKNKLQNLRTKLTRFRLYYRFSQISHMNLHNSALKLWREQLGLDNMLEELARDVAEADKQIKLYLDSDLQEKEKIKEEDSKKKEQKLNKEKEEREIRWQLITAFGSFAGFFFLISAIFSLYVNSLVPQKEKYEKLLKDEATEIKQDYQNFLLPNLIDLSNSAKQDKAALPKELELDLCSKDYKKRNDGQDKFCNETKAMRDDIENAAWVTMNSFWITLATSFLFMLILIQLRFSLLSNVIRKYSKVLNKIICKK